MFWLNDHLGEDVRLSINAGRGGDGPPLLALDAVGELRHKHYDDGEHLYEVGDGCFFELPLDAAEDAKIQGGQLAWLGQSTGVRAAGGRSARPGRR